MRKSIILPFILVGSLLASTAFADVLELKNHHPDRYVVKKGDTLWDISGKFLKKPWRWPEIWNMNRDEIKNPHWIYPGDIIALDMSGKTPRLRLIRNGEPVASGANTVRLSPKVRYSDMSEQAIQTISPAALEPFLNRPLAVDKAVFDASPKVVAGVDSRVVYAAGDKIYATGFNDASLIGQRWHVYRAGVALSDPDGSREAVSKEDKTPQNLLGYEAIYIGDVTIGKVAEVSTLKVIKTAREIEIGDRLIPFEGDDIRNFVPRAPVTDPKAKVIHLVDGVGESGQYSVVVLNKGRRDGVERGHVLALEHAGRAIPKTNKNDKNEKQLYTPDEVFGDALVFRVFEKLSYAIVMESESPVHLLDKARKP